MQDEIEQMAAGLLKGSRRSLAKALTLVESRNPKDRAQANQLVQKIYPHTGGAKRIGISGPPGVGKSTFIETFGAHALDQGHRLAVLAIDPSSPRSHGSIMGDKTRMASLAVHPACFIRPSPSGLSLGGVARRTRECILLCEAAGYNMVIIETVGVGQSEALVQSMVDIFMLLALPHAGDQLQGIKRGILELVDMVVVTKADGAFQVAARQALMDYKSALHYRHQDQTSIEPRFFLCSSVEGTGITDIYQGMEEAFAEIETNQQKSLRRQQQIRNWFESELYEQLLDRIKSLPDLASLLAQTREAVLSQHIAPPQAASDIVNSLMESWSGCRK